jgi:hypothetical protein
MAWSTLMIAQEMALRKAFGTRMAQRMAFPTCLVVVVVGVVIGLANRSKNQQTD